MKTHNIILLLTLSSASMLATAENNPSTVSQQQYQNAIASFGVSQQNAEIASKEAVRLVKKQHQSDTLEKASWMAKLPTNWLEGSPY